MTTTYLRFPDLQTSISTLLDAGYQLSQYNDHCQGNGWGPIFSIGENSEIFVNLYDCITTTNPLLDPYVVPEPITPYNVRAGDHIDVTYRCVIVPDALRDTCRMMVVSIAGMTHANMWSTPLSPTGQLPATHWINSGPMRTSLTTLLDDANALSQATKIPLSQAQYILSICDISSQPPDIAIQRTNLQYII